MTVSFFVAVTPTHVDACISSPVFIYYHGDHLGSSNIITDRSGTLVDHYEYFAFGKDRYNPGCSFQPSNKFTGQIKDDDTGLYYYNARYYDPELGRFIQPDTIVPSAGDPQSLNRYSYVRNNPLMYVDPTGHYVTPGLALRHSLESGETSPDVPVSEAPPSQSNSSSSKDALEFAQKLDGFVRMGLPVSPFQRSGNVGGSQVIIALHAPDHQGKAVAETLARQLCLNRFQAARRHPAHEGAADAPALVSAKQSRTLAHEPHKRRVRLVRALRRKLRT